MSHKKFKFEDAMDELEQIVDRLEQGEIPLEQAIDMFKEGMELSKKCVNTLNTAEKTIRLLIQNEDGQIEEQDFSAKENGECI